MEKLKADKKSVPKLKEYIEGRVEDEIYNVVYSTFIPAVSTTEYYKYNLAVRMRSTSDYRELFTKSDEAFTLLLLENYYDRWIDIYKRHGGEPPTSRGTRKKKFQSQIQPRYTRGGNIYEEPDGSSNQDTDTLPKIKRGKGWTNEGIERYNELFKQVGADRANNPLFIKRFLKAKKAEKDVVEDLTPKKVKNIVIPIDELGDDMDAFDNMEASPKNGKTGKSNGSVSSESESDHSDSATEV